MSQNNGSAPIEDPGPFVEHHDHLKHNYLERVAPARNAYDATKGKKNAMAKVAAALGYDSLLHMSVFITHNQALAHKRREATRAPTRDELGDMTHGQFPPPQEP